MSEPHAAERCLLVVDDDVKFASALARAMKRRGYRTVVAHDADEALEEADAWGPPYGAILDLRMPGPDGLELLRQLRERYPKVRAVLLTGYGSISSAVDAMKIGAVNYLTKPTDADAIARALEEPASAPNDAGSKTVALDELEWEHVQQTLAETGGNVSEAARRLGIHRRTLQRKLARGGPG